MSQGAVLDFKTSPARFRWVVATLKPAFAGLTPERLARLEALTGRDLLLLDDLLWDLASPEEIDRLNRDELFRRVRRHYFGARALYLPTVHKLAALAQFDLAPPTSRFDGRWLPDAPPPLVRRAELYGCDQPSGIAALTPPAPAPSDFKHRLARRRAKPDDRHARPQSGCWARPCSE